MNFSIKKTFEFLFQIDAKERLKLLFLTASFFFIIGGYTILKELKDAIFVNIVGDEYIPLAKIISTFVLIPPILFYSFLVDKIRRYHLLYFYSILYGILGLVFTYYLGDPVIGIANTATSPYRIFGWMFYFFVEGFSPFVVSVFWAFANSINNPEAAKKNYGLMVSGSKLGGMVTAILAWQIFDCSNKIMISTVAKHQILMALASILLLFIPLLIYLLMKKVPGRYLHGYEAVYQVEKEKVKEIKEEEKEKPSHLHEISMIMRQHKENVSFFSRLSLIIKEVYLSVLDFLKHSTSGLVMFVRQPYVLGILGVISFYEIVNVVLSFQRLIIAKKASQGISELSCVLFKQVFMIHFFGFILSIFGTNTLLRKFGERKCLIFVPAVTGVLLFIFTFYSTLNVSVAVFIVLRTLNYALAYPLRESLYIPTVKDIKFKSKSWIDSVGAKFARLSGSVYNLGAKSIFNSYGVSVFIGMQSIFFGVIIGLWIVTAYLLGRRYDRAIKNNEVIGVN